MNIIKAHLPSEKSFTHLDEFFFASQRHLRQEDPYPIARPSAESEFDLYDDLEKNSLINWVARREDLQ